MSLNVGDTVGDYQIIGVLGAGGMGKVYKVRNIISDRVEALKVLLPNLAEEPDLADRFIREIKLLASLDHPNIASLHTALRLENQLLMLMEFVEGTTLEERLKRGPLPVPEAVGCVDQVLAALQYAHERGIIHRDIKPANMMLTPGGAVKLMDFGIAKASADRRLTATGTTMGSLFYMSPEQIKGSATLDARADLYSVGVSLYELVTGQRPFKGDSDYSIMVAHLEQEPVPPIQIDPLLPQVLNDLILTAIQKDPAKRFQTAQVFRAALKHVAGGFAAASPAVQAPAPPPRPAAPPPPFQAPAPAPMTPPPAARPASRRGLYMALGALTAVAVIVVAATQLPRWQKTQAGESAAPAAQQMPMQTQPPAQQTPSPVQPTAAQPPAAQETKPVQPLPAALESRPPTRPPRTATQAAEPAKTAPPVQPPPPAAEPARQAPSEPAVSPELREAFRKEFLQVRERAISVAARADALRSSLKNLEDQQRRSGLSLRTDIATSWKRMDYFLDEAEAALKARDLPGAKRAVTLAEREADKLDQFLGR